MSVILHDGEVLSKTVWNVHSVENEKKECTIVLKPTWHEKEKNVEKRRFVKRIDLEIDISDFMGEKYMIKPDDAVIMVSSKSAKIMHQTAMSTFTTTRYIFTLDSEQELTDDTEFQVHLTFTMSYQVKQVTARVIYVEKDFDSVESITGKIAKLQEQQSKCFDNLHHHTAQLRLITSQLSEANAQLQERQKNENRDVKSQVEQIKQVLTKK